MVANYITEMLDNDDGIAEIQRNELANVIGCVPSQINYVLSSRFTQEQGYIVESRRGGGGYIKITRISMDCDTFLMHLINSIGSTLDERSAAAIIDNLQSANYLEPISAKIMKLAISSKVYTDIPNERRNNVRASIFKNMLLALL